MTFYRPKILNTDHLALDVRIVAVVFFSGVNYFTGQVFDMQRITEAAHKKVSFSFSLPDRLIRHAYIAQSSGMSCWLGSRTRRGQRTT